MSAMPNPVTVFRNEPLPATATNGTTATIGEPSVAVNGSQIYFSGNNYAVRSLDDANTWTNLMPHRTLPVANGGLCCDQTLIYDPSRDLTLWLLQYYTDDTGGNTLRLVVKKGSGGGAFDYYHDFVAGALNAAWANYELDYNSAALSSNYLYITTNVFATTATQSRWAGATVIRVSLDELQAQSALTVQVFTTTQWSSLRCMMGARDVMYFGSHRQYYSQVAVFTWPESATQVAAPTLVTVNPWNRGVYNAPGPDGLNWLSRLDDRITGAFLADGKIGFLWSANTKNDRPYPYVRVVRIDAQTLSLVDQPEIWSSTTAYAYPDACTNDAGVVGIALFCGGGPYYPSHLVGIALNQRTNWQWSPLFQTRAGTNGPADTKWGDYLTCRTHYPDAVTFSATGFTLQGGSRPGNIEPRYVHFGASTVAIESAQFPGVYLRMEGQDTGPNPLTVNGQIGAGAWEQFSLQPQPDGTVAIASVAFPNAYVSLDASTFNAWSPTGGGTVSCSLGAVGPLERFRFERQSDGTVAIASVQFPGVYLRMAADGFTQWAPAGGGTVNSQVSQVGNVGSHERFRIRADDGTASRT